MHRPIGFMVSDIKVSKAFYDAAFGPLGVRAMTTADARWLRRPRLLVECTASQLRRHPDKRTYAPVLECGAATALDSGEFFWRSQMDRTTRTAVDRNSLCQFWKLSNHSCASPR